jgi:hypothetical protein
MSIRNLKVLATASLFLFWDLNLGLIRQTNFMRKIFINVLYVFNYFNVFWIELTKNNMDRMMSLEKNDFGV